MAGQVRFDLLADSVIEEDDGDYPSSQYANYDPETVHGHRKPVRQEIPDSQESANEAEDDWAEEDPADEQEDEGPAEELSQVSVETVIIPGGSKPPKKRQPGRPLHAEGFNVNGRLPSESPQFSSADEMEEEPTQQATQPFLDPRRLGRNGSNMREEDESDVICILHPGSHAAYSAVKLMVSASPQHILQNEGLSRYLEEDELEESEFDDCDDTGFPDIALRLSSRVKDPRMGFVFGRDPRNCDIIIGSQDPERRVSNVHLRIFLNPGGIIMLEDMSTNGTCVDGTLLAAMKPNGMPRTRMLQQGAVIKLITPKYEEGTRFIVGIPTRNRGQEKYESKLSQYLAYINQLQRQGQAVAECTAKGLSTAPPLIPLNPLKHGMGHGAELLPEQPVVSLAAGTNPYHYGSHWSGGDNYNIVGRIGSGAFATVYKLATKQNGEVFAVKECEKRRFLKNGLLNHKVNTELDIMKTLRHPYIVKYVDHADTEKYLYIIMEFASCGDISAYTHAGQPMPEYMCQSLARQICSALEYLHKRGITHRDLKPENILVSSNDPFTVKLSDFGLSKVVGDDDTVLRTFCGTLLYCAPEIFPAWGIYKKELEKGSLPPPPRKRHRPESSKTAPYTGAVDVWSFAAVTYHLLSSKAPFTGTNNDNGATMLDNICRFPLNIESLKQAGVSGNGIDFLRRMLVIQPTLRAKFEDCLQHPWLEQASSPTDAATKEFDEDDVLNASQLSLEDIPEESMRNTSDDEDEDVDEIDHARRSKRLKTEQYSFANIGRVSSTDVPYPHPPQMQTDQGPRLFGEIGVSALRSSGVLGYDAHMALEMPVEGSSVEGASASEVNRSDQNLNTTSEPHVTTNEPSHHPLQYPRRRSAHTRNQSATSLFGAEALVGQLNMASPESGVSAPSAPVTPKTPRDTSPFSSEIPGSKRSSQPLQPTTTERTPKRTKLNSDADYDPSTSQSQDLQDSQNREDASLLQSDSGNTDTASGPNAQYDPAPTNTHSFSPGMTLDEVMEALGDTETNIAGAISTLERIEEKKPEKEITAQSDNEVGHTSALQSTTPEPAAEQSQETNSAFVKPPQRFGKLTTVAGSFWSSTIHLQDRLTTFGRDPASTYPYPDPKDTRVPKNALYIFFWKSGIEPAIRRGEDWTQMDNLYALVVTNARCGIRVNGVPLPKGLESRGWKYGKLYTGDIVSVYEEKAKGWYLQFVCEFSIGLSKETRREGDVFTVEREMEKWAASMARKSEAQSGEQSGGEASSKGSTSSRGSGLLAGSMLSRRHTPN